MHSGMIGVITDILKPAARSIKTRVVSASCGKCFAFVRLLWSGPSLQLRHGTHAMAFAVLNKVVRRQSNTAYNFLDQCGEPCTWSERSGTSDPAVGYSR